MNIEQFLQKVDEYFAVGQGAQAEALMLQGIEEARQAGQQDGMLQLLNELLGYYRETGQVQASYEIAERAVALAVEMGLQDTIPYATTLLNVANAYRAGGRWEDSLACYDKVRAVYQIRLSEDSMLWASFYNNMSLLYQEMGDFAKAKECLLQALAIVTAKEAGFEIAVTHANLATTCMQLQEVQEAYDYAGKAIASFEQMQCLDTHYGAALAAMGNICYSAGKYAEAKDWFGKASGLMEQFLGRNEYYDRLQENIRLCERALEGDRLKGLELCREYYETYGKPMIEEQFAEYASRIAVGLVGEGSDCFGFDDEYSRDHDWGPGFCMWVPVEVYDVIGEQLQEAYNSLPQEYKGYRRVTTPQARGRTGVMVIEDFYNRLLGYGRYEDIIWENVQDYGLAAAINGKVFRDTEGRFLAMRSKLSKGYPEPVLYAKLAESMTRFAQCGQYNLNRMLQRGDVVTARMMLSDAIREAVKIGYYARNCYPLHDKWLLRGLQEIEGMEPLVKMIREASDCMGDAVSLAGAVEKTEEIAGWLAQDLYQAGFISDVEPYLAAHAEELIAKRDLSRLDDKALIDKIIRLEFDAFDKVKNEGGRASCQNDWPTFYVMRKSLYLTWNRTMLLQYCYDFEREYRLGHNLIEEKYGRMMESTAPEQYEQMKQYFPEITPQKQAIIEQIVAMQVGWMEAFAEEYPKLAANARSIRTGEDNRFNTSYETYLRGEISTYSDKMLELYGRYIVDYARWGDNPVYQIMGNSASMYGYHDLAHAETHADD